MAPIHREFDGGEFLKDLLSDMGPLLALFGGQVIKQFLSMSLGFEDHLLLSTGPIGVVTIVVSAIRIAGSKTLKALIGRAREERSSVEKELLSSTSNEVCELWTGREIVRIKGQCPAGMKTLAVTKKGEVLGLEATWEKFFRPDGLAGKAEMDAWRWTCRFVDAPPNLSLNVQDSTKLSRETWMLALINLAFQVIVVVMGGVVSYRPDLFNIADVHPPPYSYPLYLVGTLLLSLGIMGCGYVIEAATTELNMRCKPERAEEFCPVRIQPSCTVGDQQFRSFAIFNSFDNPNIHISLREEDKGKHRKLVSINTVASAIGFGTQFFGLWALHWSISVGQFGVTITGTVLRAVSRRGLALVPPNFSIMSTHEMAWLALGASTAKRAWLCQTNSAEVTGSRCSRTANWQQMWEEYSGRDIRWELATAGLKRASSWLPNNQPGPFALARPLSTVIKKRSELTQPAGAGASQSMIWDLEAFCSVKEVAPKLLPPGVEEKARQLMTAVAGVANLLMASQEVTWKQERVFAGPLDAEHPPQGVSWRIPIIYERHPPVEFASVQSLTIELEPRKFEDRHSPYAWHLSSGANIEGILCFWLRHATDTNTSLSHASSAPSLPRRFYRLVGTSHRAECDAEELARWIGKEIRTLTMDREGNLSLVELLGPDDGASLCFGMSLSHLSSDSDLGLHLDDSEGRLRLHGIATYDHDSEIVTHCVQELFSVFILAITAEIRAVGGVTTPLSPLGGTRRSWDNTLLTALAGQAVLANLATTLDEALALVVPAFAHHNLLPYPE